MTLDHCVHLYETVQARDLLKRALRMELLVATHDGIRLPRGHSSMSRISTFPFRSAFHHIDQRLARLQDGGETTCFQSFERCVASERQAAFNAAH
jgi:hypothetical protein